MTEMQIMKNLRDLEMQKKKYMNSTDVDNTASLDEQ
jgi:uncharacterized protein YkvS